MHNDGIVYFPINGSSKHGLIVQNHEYTDDGLLFTDGVANWNAEKTAKSQNAHGVGIIEVRRRRGAWEVVRPSRYARRITAQTPMRDRRSGGRPRSAARRRRPDRHDGARHAQQLRDGLHAVGHVPRLRGELQRLLQRSSRRRRPALARSGYGIGTDRRTTPVVHHRPAVRRRRRAQRAEPLRLGVRDQPVGPREHAGQAHRARAASSTKAPGCRRPATVASSSTWATTRCSSTSTATCRTSRGGRACAEGISPLDDGVLYVARFDANGTGTWLPLTPDNPALAGWSLEEILINTRYAADLVGATKMDRPEWIDTYPDELMAVATLTNNTGRGVGANPRRRRRQPPGEQRVRPHPSLGLRRRLHGPDTSGGTSSRSPATATPRRPTGRRSTATSSGHPTASTSRRAAGCGSRPTCRRDRRSTAARYAGFGNNQMLCADPTTRRTRRFLVGPDQVRDHRLLRHARRDDAVRRHPAPGRSEQRTQRSGQPEAVQLVARRRRRRHGPLGAARDHQGRRRRDRQLRRRPPMSILRSGRAGCSSLPRMRSCGACG